MSYLCDLFFIAINHITFLIQTHLLFCTFLEYLLLFLDDKVDEENGQLSINKSSASEHCLVFA